MKDFYEEYKKGNMTLIQALIAVKNVLNNHMENVTLNDSEFNTYCSQESILESECAEEYLKINGWIIKDATEDIPYQHYER